MSNIFIDYIKENYGEESIPKGESLSTEESIINIRNKYGKDCILTNECFAIYSILDKYLYIEDVYVKPEFRGNKTSHSVVKKLEESIKDKKVNRTLVSVNKEVKNIERCINNILSYGFTYKFEDDKLMYFSKEIL